MFPEWVFGHHEIVADEREHHQSVFYRLSPSFVLLSEIAKVVI